MRRELYQRHLQFFAAGGAHDPMAMWCGEDCDGTPHRDRLMLAANRIGKALRNGTKVWQGGNVWTPIEQLKVGAVVAGEDGKPAFVVGVYPQEPKRLMTIKFEGGAEIVCCEDHLWKASLAGDDRWMVVTAWLLADQVWQGARWQVPTYDLDARERGAPRQIVGIRIAGVPELSTCIAVDHPAHTFVTAHGIVTHNTESLGGYETTLHLTGRYPHWWNGHRFERPIDCWAAGKRNESTRDIIQRKLLGDVAWKLGAKTVSGTGLVPAEDIGGVTWKRGIADFVDTVRVKHRLGGWSTLGLKSYEQGRGAFEGTEKDLIWLDEEPPLDVYVECGIRLMTRAGHLLLTFTPMEGMSDVVLEFLPGGAIPGTGDV